VKYVVAFFKFWYDFLIGDTPEIFLGAVLVLLVAYALSKSAEAPAILPALVIVILVLSVGFAVVRSLTSKQGS
jgi:hypothetical protein